MKSLNNNKYHLRNTLFIFFLIIVGLSSCDKDDDIVPPPPLNAEVGEDQEAKINDTVTLDGSGSTGPEGFTYLWTYEGEVPENEINFQGLTTANPTFVPPLAGAYRFKLTISHDGATNSDETTVLVGGSIEIGGILSENLVLKNVQGNSSLPDYTVVSDIIVPDGIVLSVGEEDVNIEFKQGTGLHVKDGGRFTNVDESQVDGYEGKLYGEDGWKGILVENGTLYLCQNKIINAGAEVFAGQPEAAAITFIGDQSKILNIGNNEFIESQSYDILSLVNVTGSGYVYANSFSSKNPMKISPHFMGFFSRLYPNFFPDNYEYSIIVPSGSEKMDVAHRTHFFFPTDADFYIDGDFWAGDMIEIGGNTNIFMKEGAAILLEKKLLARVFPQTPIVIEGLNGSNWKGIASNYNEYLGFEMENVTVKNAGFGIMKFSSFEADVSAALYVNSQGSILRSKIENSGGFGFYNPSLESSSFSIVETHFINTAAAAIRTNPLSVGRLLYKDHNCKFELAENIPAYLVQGEGAPQYDWPSLGEDDYYLIDAFLSDETSFRVEPGTILKFRSGRSLIRNNKDVFISFRGTQEKPIVLEGEVDMPGSWGGVYLGTYSGFEHVIIRNGGEFVLPNATEKANVVSAVPLDESIFEMINTTISNSAGYGIVIEAGTKDFDYENPANENIFEKNALGDVIRK